jgi:hypothetical protein
MAVYVRLQWKQDKPKPCVLQAEKNLRLHKVAGDGMGTQLLGNCCDRISHRGSVAFEVMQSLDRMDSLTARRFCEVLL